MSGNIEDEIMSSDCFKLKFDIGDIVLFPSSGTMEEAEIIAIGTKPNSFTNRNFITVKTNSGYKKHKRSKNVINKTKLDNILKNIYPENYV